MTGSTETGKIEFLYSVLLKRTQSQIFNSNTIERLLSLSSRSVFSFSHFSHRIPKFSTLRKQLRPSAQPIAGLSLPLQMQRKPGSLSTTLFFSLSFFSSASVLWRQRRRTFCFCCLYFIYFWMAKLLFVTYCLVYVLAIYIVTENKFIYFIGSCRAIFVENIVASYYLAVSLKTNI